MKSKPENSSEYTVFAGALGKALKVSHSDMPGAPGSPFYWASLGLAALT